MDLRPTRTAAIVFFAGLLPAAAAAQHQEAEHGAHHAATAPSASAVTIPPAAVQIAGAVMAAPEELRSGAAVLGYAPDGKFVELREGSNEMICLADDPSESPRWHVACYHQSLEPFMARGRELVSQGVTGWPRDSIRNADIVAGRLKMPPVGGLYTVTAETGCFVPSTGTLCKGAELLHSVYVPFATPESTGLLDHPTDNHTPWLMSAGTPKAHIMFGKHEHH